MLQISSLYKHGEQGAILNDINLDINLNEIFCILGASGAGKSTLLRIIAGLDDKYSGNVYMMDEDITKIPPYKRDISLMFQTSALFPYLNGIDNIRFTSKNPNYVQHIIKQLKIEHLIDKYSHQMSEGEKQRISFARALVKQASIILLDEPFSALDKVTTKTMHDEVLAIQRETNIGILMVTHDQSEAMKLADRIAIIKDGKILQVGKPQEIYEAPQNTFVAEFIGKNNIMHGKVLNIVENFAMVFVHQLAQEVMIPISKNTNIKNNDYVNVSIRPEKLQVSPDGKINGQIINVEYLGNHSIAKVLIEKTGYAIDVILDNSKQVNTNLSFSWKRAQDFLIIK